MGRTEPTVVKPPPAFRRDARAKRARATINKVIPALLTAHPRARRGIERSELILDPPRLTKHGEGKVGAEGGGSDGAKNGGGVPTAKGSGRRRKSNLGDEQLREKTAARRRDDGDDNNTLNRRIEKEKETGEVNGPRITLCVADTLAAAHSLLVPGPSSSPTQQSKHQNQNQQQSRSHAERTAESSRGRKVGILNMASPLSPGGGFLNGATSQEESLCMRTTLLPALRDEFYRLPELGIVYTPDVLVFRPTSSPSSSSVPDRKIESGESTGNEGADEKDILPKNDRWFTDVVTAAMLRLPETENSRYASPADRELVLRKMRAVMRVFAAKGCTHVVLGAWGCGAYGNPVSEIAEAWRRVLVSGPNRTPNHIPNQAAESKADSQGRVDSKGEGKEGKSDKSGKSRNRNANPETWSSLVEEVVFAIKDGSMASAFARVFGEDVLPNPNSDSNILPGEGSLSGDEDQVDDPVQAAQLAELREKIAQLEIQVAQVRSPQLKNGLETVLAGLRKQLPAEDDEDDEDEDGAKSLLGEESASELEENEGYDSD